jgi:hypothetical protein
MVACCRAVRNYFPRPSAKILLLLPGETVDIKITVRVQGGASGAVAGLHPASAPSAPASKKGVSLMELAPSSVLSPAVPLDAIVIL